LDDWEDGGGEGAARARGADGCDCGYEGAGGTGDALGGHLARVAGVGGVGGVPDGALEGRAGAGYVGCHCEEMLAGD
jgi:hypothetical protein